MTHDDASVETGVGGQAKYDVMMVFFGIALQKHWQIGNIAHKNILKF